MSENISKLFKDWMVATGKTPNTASSYTSGVNTVSKHCGRDVFEITDLNELDRLYQQYGPKGEFADIGASNSNNVQSGLKQWLDYQQQFSQASRLDVGVNKTSSVQTPALNQILYGPPGTGKTYETIYTALQILDPVAAAAYKQVDDGKGVSPEQSLAARAELKARFDELSAEQRVRFVTFHQSFSYEDFVEGLRAENDDAGQLHYVVQNGVFKQLVRDAQHVEVSGQSTIQVADDAKIWKVSIGGTGPSALKDYCLKHGQARIGWAALGNIRDIDERGRQYFEKLGSNNQNTVHTFANEVAVGDVIVSIDGQDEIGAVGVVTRDYFYEALPEINDNHYPHAIGVDWLYKNLSLSARALNDGKPFVQKTVYPLWRFKWPILLEAILKSGARAEETARVSSTAAKLPHVLIIDEINRGNISRIFGELITLIEPSKRAGADEALSVTLPYSKERFSVPDNVYIIGTMNTADRSLAGLDLALRRRFSFTEMPPRPELLDGVVVDGINIGQMLRVMNQRITVLLGRDHTIGHAYFMPLQKEGSTLAELADIFRQKILPLLQEYFFEDWERIRWVLNDQNKSQKKEAAEAFIIEDKVLDLSGLFKGVQDRLRQSPQWVLNARAFANPAAYRDIAANPGKTAQVQFAHDQAIGNGAELEA